MSDDDEFFEESCNDYVGHCWHHWRNGLDSCCGCRLMRESENWMPF